MPNLTAGYLLRGIKPTRLGNGHPNTAPYGVFRTRDGEIVLAVGNDVQWRRLCDATGHEDFAEDPRWVLNRDRQDGRAELEAIVEEWFQEFSTSDLVQRLTTFEVPHGPIQSVDEALDGPQATALGSVTTIVGSDGEGLRMVGSPLHFASQGEAQARRPPHLDENRDDVLQEVLGYDRLRAADLAQRGAFGRMTR